MEPTQEQVQVKFKKFAEFLFDQENPEENSLDVDKTFNDDQEFCNFLYELFCYGFNKKFNHLSLKDLKQEHFSQLRKYIRAVGADVDLLGYEKNDQGEIVDVKFGFKPFYKII